MIDKQINECRKTIESLKGLLIILSSGTGFIIAMFFFFKEEFSPIIAKTLLISLGLVLALVLFIIFRKYAIIEQLNLKGR